MSNVVDIAKNSTVLTAGSVLTRIIEFLILLFLTRFLSVDGIGVYLAIFTYLGYTAVFVDSGMVLILRRECASRREQYPQYIGNAITLVFLLTAAAAVISYTILQFSSYPEAVKLIYIYGIPTLITSSRFISLRRVLEVMFIVDFKVHINVIYSLLDRLIFLGCVFWFIRHSHSPLQAVAMAALAEMVSFGLLGGAYIKRFKWPRPGFKPAIWKYLLAQSWPNLLSSLAYMTVTRGGLLILAAMKSPAEVAIYGIASRIPLLINFIPAAFLEPVSIVLAKKFTVHKGAFFNVYSFTIRYLLFMAFPFILLLIIEAGDVIDFLFPASYHESVPIIRVLLVAELFSWSITGFNNGLLAGRLQVAGFKILGASAALCVVLCFALIPAYGAMGAAAATLAGMAIYIVLGLMVPSTHEFAKIIVKSAVRPALAGAFMFACLVFFDLNMWLSATAGPCLFFGALYLLRGFNQKDLAFLLELFPNSRLLNHLKK